MPKLDDCLKKSSLTEAEKEDVRFAVSEQGKGIAAEVAAVEGIINELNNELDKVYDQVEKQITPSEATKGAGVEKNFASKEYQKALKQSFYHGSAEAELQIVKKSKYGDFGSGVYVTPDKKFAGMFAKGTAFDKKREKQGKVFKVSFKHPKNPFLPENTPLTRKEIDFIKTSGEQLEEYTRYGLIEEYTGRNFTTHDQKDISLMWDDFLKKFGYDAVWDGTQLVLRNSIVKVVVPKSTNLNTLGAQDLYESIVVSKTYNDAKSHLQELATRIYSAGATKFTDFKAKMQESLKDAWGRFKDKVLKLFQYAKTTYKQSRLGSEQGAVGADITPKPSKESAKERKETEQVNNDIREHSLPIITFFQDKWKSKKKKFKESSAGQWVSEAHWQKEKTDFTNIEKMLSIPSQYMRKTEASAKMYDAALQKRDEYEKILHNLIQDKDGSLYTKTLDIFQKQGDKKEYQKWHDYMNHQDIYQIGYKVKAIDDGFQLLGLKPVNGKRPVLETFIKEEDAWNAARLREAKDMKKKGFSDQAIKSMLASRAIADNGFTLLNQNMQELIRQHEAQGKDLPTVTVHTAEGKVKVDLKVALAKMGDRRGYFFPRIRRSGQYMLIAKKKGEHGYIEFFDLNIKFGKTNLPITPIAKRAIELQKKGYTYSVKPTTKLSEDVWETAKKTTDTAAVINQGLASMQKVKDHSFDDVGLKATWEKGTKGEDILYISGATSKIQGDIFKSFGGRGYTEKGEFKGWRFKGAKKGLDEKILKALLGHQGLASADTISLFAGILAEQVANEQKARGSRAHMIKRDDAIGKDVYLGYEQDPAIAYAMYARSLAAGEAKKNMAVQLVQAFTGTWESWQDYKARIKDETGDKPTYEEYLDLVNERRIDPIKQKVAHKVCSEYMVDMLRNPEAWDRIMGTLRGLAVLKYLGFRVSAPLVNLTALGTSVPATMHGYAKIPFRKIPGYLASAGKHYLKWKWGKSKWAEKFNAKGPVPLKWQKVFEEIEANGWHKAQYNREALSVLESKVSGKWRTFTEWSMAMFGATEQLNRVMTIAGTYIALQDKAKGKAFDSEKALTLAKEVASDKAHGVYHKANYPHLARGTHAAAHAVRSFYVFQTFMHNYYVTMAELGFDKKQSMAALYMAMSPVLFAGLGASPLLVTMFKGFDWLGDEDDAEEKLYKIIEHDWGMEDTARLARYGLPGLAGKGISIKGSLQVGIDVPTKPIDFLGAPGSVGTDIYEGSKQIVKGDVWKGFEKALPSFAGSAMKAYREGKEGVSTRAGGPLFFGTEQVQPTITDSLLRMLSFNPSHIAEIKEKQWKEYRLESKYRKMRTEVYDRAKRYFALPTSKRTQKRYADEVLKYILEFNARIYERGLQNIITPITGKSLRMVLKRAFKPSKKERKRAEGMI